MVNLISDNRVVSKITSYLKSKRLYFRASLLVAIIPNLLTTFTTRLSKGQVNKLNKLNKDVLSCHLSTNYPEFFYFENNRFER